MTNKQSKRLSSVKLVSIWQEWQEDKHGKLISNVRTYGSLSVKCEILKDGCLIVYENDSADNWQASFTYNKINELIERLEWLKMYNEKYKREQEIVKRHLHKIIGL